MADERPAVDRMALWRERLGIMASALIIVFILVMLGLEAADRVEARRASIVAAEARARRQPPGRPPPPPLPAEPLSLEGAPVKGDPTARVAIVEFSDFQCPYCARFTEQTLPQLEERYLATGKVLLAFRHLPLQSIHPQAFRAGEAAECARRQDKFWMMHDRIFAEPKSLDDDSLLAHASALSLDGPSFSECLAGPASAAVERDSRQAAGVGASGTPTFFIGVVLEDGTVKAVHRLEGAQPITEFEKALDKLIPTVYGYSAGLRIWPSLQLSRIVCRHPEWLRSEPAEPAGLLRRLLRGRRRLLRRQQVLHRASGSPVDRRLRA